MVLFAPIFCFDEVWNWRESIADGAEMAVAR